MLDASELYDAVGGNLKRNAGPDGDIVDRFRRDDALEIPVGLTDLELWANYVNDDLYAMDVKIREFLKKTRYQREKKGGYRTTASVVFAWMYGRKPEPGDGAACRMVNELLRYYCTSYTGATTFMGKKVPRVYEFSKYATTKKRPYSLRLRLELMEDGKDPFRSGTGHRADKRRHGRREHSADGAEADG